MRDRAFSHFHGRSTLEQPFTKKAPIFRKHEPKSGGKAPVQVIDDTCKSALDVAEPSIGPETAPLAKTATSEIKEVLKDITNASKKTTCRKRKYRTKKIREKEALEDEQRYISNIIEDNSNLIEQVPCELKKDEEIDRLPFHDAEMKDEYFGSKNNEPNIASFFEDSQKEGS